MASKDKYKPNAAGTLECARYDIQILEGKLYVEFQELLKVTTALGEFEKPGEGCSIWGEDPVGENFPLLDDDLNETGENMDYTKLLQALKSLYIRTAMRRDLDAEMFAAEAAAAATPVPADGTPDTTDTV